MKPPQLRQGQRQDGRRDGPGRNTIRRTPADQQRIAEAEAAAQAEAAAPAPAPAARPAPAPAPELGPRLDPDALMAELASISPEELAHLLAGGGLRPPEPGDQIQGRVVRVNNDGVFVDVGGKAEGVIDRAEIDPESPLKVGDSVTAYVLSVDEKGIRLARRISGKAAWSVLEQAQESGVPVDGRVESRNSGGYTVRIGPVRAFCPASQIDAIIDPDPDAYVGRTMTFRVTSVRDRDVVVSHKAIAAEQARDDAERLWGELREGALLTGTIVGVKDYGCFVDVGGLRGLVPRRELSWDAEAPMPAQNTRVSVRVIEVDAAARRLTLSMKDPDGGPWNRVGSDFEVGGVYTGRITRVLDYGAFVALAPGLEGLVHVSNMSTRRVQNPRDLFNPGDSVDVRLLSADVEAKRLELGIKQAQDSSWTPPTTEVEVAAPRADRKAPATLGKLGDLFAGIKIQVKEPAASPGRRGPSSNPRK